MIKKRFYHIGRAAVIAAFLFIGGLTPAFNFPALANQVPATEKIKKNVSKKSAKVKRTSTFENPDFAFPETVEKDALPHLGNAVKTGNGQEALKAAMQLMVARGMVSNSCFNDNVGMLDSLASTLPQPYASLSRLLEADYYKAFYEDNRWNYDRRTLPLDNYPADPSEWSKDLFARKVMALVEDANKEMAAARNTPIKDIASILDDVKDAELSHLSVEDFIVYKSMDILNAFSDSNSVQVIPFRNDGGKIAITPSEKCRDLRENLIDGLLSYRETAGNVAALSVAICRKADFMENEARGVFLKKWWERLIHEEDCARILNNYFQNLDIESNLSREEVKDLYAAMNQWLGEFTDSRFRKAVAYDVDRIKQKSSSVSLPRISLPGSSIKGKLSFKNMNEAYVLLYSVPESIVTINSLNTKQFPSKARFVKAIKIEADGEVPFSGEKEFEIDELAAGYYVAVPSDSPRLSSTWNKEVEVWSLGVVNVSDIAIVTSNNSGQKGSSRIYVVDARTQRPIEGASVKVYDNSRTKKLISQGITNSDGVYVMPEGNHSVRVAKGGSTMSQWIYFNYYKNDVKESPCANLLTDLSIYKPGQEVKFSLVGWTTLNHDNKLLKNKSVDVVLRDANWNPVDTLSLTTDEWGRCNGKFTLPTDGLLGTYSINSRFKDFPEKEAGSQTFQVAEYKAPGFLVEIDSDASTSYSAGDVIKFKGSVKTYSGMPLANSRVSFNINWQPWWRWWNSGGNASYGGVTTTDEKGSFEIELPTANLKGTRFEKGVYTLAVSATSPSGETQSAPDLRFSLGAGLSVNPAIPSNMQIKGDSLSFNVPVYDMLDHPAVKPVEYVMTDAATGKTVKSGVFDSPVLRMSGDIPSGQYKFVFNIKGDTLKADATVALFRIGDAKPPYATPLWVPRQEIICKDGESSVDVTVGSGFPSSWILCEVSDENGFVRREWLQSDGKNVKVSVKSPAGQQRTWVAFSGMHDFDGIRSIVTLIPESQTKKLEVSATSFRDKISAGGKETWRFSFKVDGKVQDGIPAMAVMSNKSLNALSPFSWNFNVGRGWWNRSDMSSTRISWLSTAANFGVISRYASIPTGIPDWNLYGYGLTSGRNYGKLMIRGMSSRSAGVEGAEAEEVLNTVHLTSLSLSEPAVKSAKKMENAAMDMDDAVTEEAQQSPGSGDGGGAGKEEIRPHPVEMPLAFFMPDLVGDPEGNVAVEFVTPDFNTTWQFQIMGYTSELLTAGLIKDAVASKPVMVQCNMPRYLRTGDKAQVTALLFNNSPENLMLRGEVEVFDPSTGEIITSYHADAAQTAPAASRTVAIDFTVPSNVSVLAVKAFAYADNYADGEQSIVPVLPSSTPVVESSQFYIKPGADDFALKLPKFRKDANLTLKYCDNPVWECVMALPSISTPDSKNLLTLMRALYANSLALDVARKYPVVREGIEKALQAKQNGDTTVLRSNLQKDANLKTVLLGNTPWVNNAASETKRMENLSSLLDEKAGMASVESILNDVISLQNEDGGWSWCPEMESSLFMTERALLHFGMMRHIGCLPSGTEKMIKKALAYCDRETYKDFIESKRKFSTASMLGYLYIRSFFDAADVQKGFKELKDKALKRISEEWKTFTIYDKATAATLLSRSKGYERQAPVILESLRQLASKDEAKGWWYDNLRSGWDGWQKLSTTAQVLEAYAEVEPNAPAVDGLRQWLVLQKETEDWGANSYTVEVIQSILSCGTDWTVSSSLPEIRIDGNPLIAPSAELLTGQMTINIDPSKVSGKELRIHKTSSGPAWGGVISQYVAPIKDVKSADCENLKIEKKILVVTDTEAGEVVKEAPVKVGDKVRVTLTLTCDKDMNYVALIDNRAACLEPDEQISGYAYKDGLSMYREVRDTKTSFFIGFLPKGVNVISYDCHADREGDYAIGIASVQSQYSPLQSAHSAGNVLNVAGE